MMDVMDILSIPNIGPNYRLGDAIICSNCAVDSLLDNAQLFKDTIGYKYIMSTARYGKFYDWDLLKVLTLDHIKKSKCDLPKDDELVIHIRLGDTGGKFSTLGRMTDKEVSNIIPVINDAITKSKPSVITVFSALHFQCDEHINDESIETNNKLFNRVMNILNEYDIPVKVKSGVVDDDLAYMSSATDLVISKGGFSLLAGLLCQGNVYGDWKVLMSVKNLKKHKDVYIDKYPYRYGDLSITTILLKGLNEI